MKSSVYVVRDVLSDSYQLPFVADSDAAACTIFYGKIHKFDLMPGFKQYSFVLYCLGEVDPEVVPYCFFDKARLVATSTFIVEGPNIHEIV